VLLDQTSDIGLISGKTHETKRYGAQKKKESRVVGAGSGKTRMGSREESSGGKNERTSNRNWRRFFKKMQKSKIERIWATKGRREDGAKQKEMGPGSPLTESQATEKEMESRKGIKKDGPVRPHTRTTAGGEAVQKEQGGKKMKKGSEDDARGRKVQKPTDGSRERLNPGAKGKWKRK